MTNYTPAMVREARRKLGFSQKELANAIGIQERTVQRLVAGSGIEHAIPPARNTQEAINNIITAGLLGAFKAYCAACNDNQERKQYD